MVVGVTGKYCAGKNAVSAILGERGYLLIDVDKLGHRALEEQKERVVERFGRSILDAEGRIDRRALGRIVFGRPGELRALEGIIHPAMVGMAAEQARGAPGGRAVINAAILFQMGLDRLCDRVLWVSAPLVVRLIRGKRRDGLPLLQVARRIWAQRKLSPQSFHNRVDIYTVRNSGDKASLVARVLKLVETGRD